MSASEILCEKRFNVEWNEMKCFSYLVKQTSSLGRLWRPSRKTRTALTMAHQSSHCDTESVSFLFEDDDDFERVHMMANGFTFTAERRSTRERRERPRDKSWQCAHFLTTTWDIRPSARERERRSLFTEALLERLRRYWWCNKRNDATSLIFFMSVGSVCFNLKRE